MFRGIGQILPRAAARHGDKTALVVGERALTYAELDRASNRLANALLGLGVAPGDRVTLYGLNSAEWVIGYHAIAKLGAVINPINVMLTPEEVVFVTRDCEASAILIGPEKLEAFLDVARDTPVRQVVALGTAGQAGQAGVHDFETLLGSASDDLEVREVAPDAVATIGYTSGTTGHPKGAMQSQRAVAANIALTATMHVKTAADTVVTALPLPHVYGNVVVNGGLMTGMTVVLLARFEERVVLEATERHRATMLEGVPTMYQYLLNSPELERHDLSSLTRCTVGGQTMPVAKMEEVEARLGCPLIELWGMTELAGLGTTFPAYGEIRHGSIGVALPTVQARIAAIEDPARSLSADEVGELMIKGPIVMQGYYGNEPATRATIEPDGWLHTGDLARTDADGYIFVVDRSKDMINSAGFKVYPAEVERVLAAHASVAMVAVGGQPDPLKGEVPKAYVVLRQGATGDAEALLGHCRARLAAYKIPRSVQFVADLPKTSTGKIMRRELKSLDPTDQV
jgi:long-chain acyl-CoA synthetase